MTPVPLSCLGRPRGFRGPVIGRVTTTSLLEGRGEAILVGDERPAPGYAGILTKGELRESLLPPDTPVIDRASSVSHLRDGDVVRMEPRGVVRTLFRSASHHNALLLTERCNSNCLMCSQPPKDRDDRYLADEALAVVRLIDPQKTEWLCLTGGEPTLLGERFLDLIELCRDHLPRTHVHVLSNGRRFAEPAWTAAVASIGHPNLTFGVPLYAPIPEIHDFIVQSRGAFDETMIGLHQMAHRGLRVELRTVLHRQTIPHLRGLADYVFRNLTFVEHVALMGLEPMGYVRKNWELLWIDPLDYQQELESAARFLHLAGMNVSIYNLPLCVLPRVLWRFARQSVSDWKNIFLPECTRCTERERCAGLFASANLRHSRGIRPILSGTAGR